MDKTDLNLGTTLYVSNCPENILINIKDTPEIPIQMSGENLLCVDFKDLKNYHNENKSTSNLNNFLKQLFKLLSNKESPGDVILIQEYRDQI